MSDGHAFMSDQIHVNEDDIRMAAGIGVRTSASHRSWAQSRGTFSFFV